MPVVDTVDVRRLRRSAFVAGVGDGIAAVALPLLAAGVTRDPLAVAVVVAAQHVPWAVLALLLPLLRTADRRTLAGAAGSARAVAVGVVGLQAAVGEETILTIQLVAFVLGVAQALTSEAEQVGAEGLVAQGGSGEHVPLATAGLLGVAVVGFPAGGFLYELLAPVPLLADVAVFAVAALLVLSPRRPLVPEAGHEADRDGTPPARAPAWRLPHAAPGTRTAMASATVSAAASGGVLGVLVLLALDDLGLGAPAFGLLLTGLAASSALGALAGPRLADLTTVEVGAVLALVVAAAGYVAAWALLDPDAPVAGAVALGVATAGAMAAAVLARAQLHGAAGAVVAGEGLRAFHLVVWAATPAGAVAGGLAARSVAVADVLLGAAGACVVAAVLAAVVRPASVEGDVAAGPAGKALDPHR